MFNVLSLFDGCAGARVALDRLGISCTYYASEIDKYAIKIAKKNYPDIIELGDIQTFNFFTLPKIDLVIGGSPCQDLSGAGLGAGINGSRSRLFFDYCRLVRYLKPKYLVLENVYKMHNPKVNKFIMSLFLGVEPVMINASLVSAQNRERLYWTNLEIQQPEDKHILLKDILENGIVERDKSYCIDANYWKGTNFKHFSTHHVRQVVYLPEQIGYINKNQQGRRVYSTNAKAVTLKSEGGGWGAKMGLYLDDNHIRMLTPVECERLQTLPDNYTEGVSKTRRYTMLGNGFCVDVIKHILSYMEL